MKTEEKTIRDLKNDVIEYVKNKMPTYLPELAVALVENDAITNLINLDLKELKHYLDMISHHMYSSNEHRNCPLHFEIIESETFKKQIKIGANDTIILDGTFRVVFKPKIGELES